MTKKRILIGGGALLLVVVMYVLVRGDAVEVSTAIVQRDTLSVTIPVEGRTRARERFTVAAPISGRLTRIDLEEGDSVQAGQVLARLYPAPEDPRVVATVRAEVSAAEARFEEAQARLREAELQATQAQREVERRRPLAEIGAITEERMEQAELAATVAEERRASVEAALATARAALQAARARLLGAGSADDVRPFPVTAPVSGRVVSIPDESARVVPAGATLLEIAATGGLEVVLDVLSEDAVAIEPGDPLLITGWGGEETLSGEVRTITRVGYTKISALGVEEQRVNVIAVLHDRPPTLGTGYRVSGEIVVWTGADVPTVPTSALFRLGDSWRAFVVEDGRARGRSVEIGHRSENVAEVLDGLSEGDRVILFPSEEIDDGVTVRVAESLGDA